MNLQQSNDFQNQKISLLDNTMDRSERSFWVKKQQREEEKQQFNVKNSDEKLRKIIINKGFSLGLNGKFEGIHQRQRKEKCIQYDKSKQSMYYGLDESERIEFYSLVGQLKQIESRQKQLRKWMSSFICWVTVVLLLVLIFYIILLKILFFFDTQLVGTIVESFKDQMFDPKITTDQLQLQVFYIEQGCFILTVILVFLFILTFTVIVSRYYQKRIEKYRQSKKIIKSLDQRKQLLLTKLKEFKNISFKQYQ